MIEKILERLEELEDMDICTSSECCSGDCGDCIQHNLVKKAISIVQEVAKEYGKDTNVCSNDYISRSVLLDKLQKWKFANEERGYDTASDLVQEMIDLVKEQPSAPYQKGE